MRHKWRGHLVSCLFAVISVVAFRLTGYDFDWPTYVLAFVIIVIGDVVREVSE